MNNITDRVTSALLSFSLVLFTFVSLTSLHAQEEDKTEQNKNKWGADVKAVGQLGTDRSIGELDFFLPVYQTERTLLFGDLRGKFDDESSREGNYGAGLRYMLENGWNLGGYGFFDVRESQNDNRFKQATIGVEAMSTDWDARINGYLPFGDTEKSEPSQADVSLTGGNIQLKSGQEKALDGLDAEVGYRLPITEADSGTNARVYAGGYYFDADGVDEVAGPRVRGEFRWDDPLNAIPGSRLTLTAKWQDDDPRGSQAFVGARVSIPLPPGDGSRSTLSVQERRMTEYVQRDVDIVTQAGAFGDSEDVRVVASGVKVQGAEETTELNGSAVNAAGQDGVILLKGGQDGLTSGGITLLEGQTLIGGGHEVTVEGVNSGQTATLKAPGSRPTIYGGGASDDFVLEVDSNTYVGGVDIGPGDANGIDEAGIQTPQSVVSNITIADTAISNVEDQGIDIQGPSEDILIRNSTIANTAEEGVLFDDATGATSPLHSDVAIVNSTIEAIQDDGVDFDDEASDIRVENSSFQGISDTHLYFNDDLTGFEVSDSVLRHSEDDGMIYVSGDMSDARIANNEFAGSDDIMIEFDSEVHSTEIVDNNIQASPGNDGIDIDEDVSDLLIARNTFESIDGDAISLSESTDPVDNVTIKGNTIRNAFDDAIYIDSDDTSNIVIRNNTIRGVQSNGMNLNDMDNAIITNNTLRGIDDIAMDIDDASGALIADNTITDVVDDDAIEISNPGTGLEIRRNKIENIDGIGLDISSGASDLVIANNSIRNLYDDDAIEISTSDSNITIRDNTLANADGYGIDFDMGSSDSGLTVVNNRIVNTESDGIEADADDVLIKNNRIATFEDSTGMDLDGSDLEIVNNTVRNSDDGLIEIDGGESNVRIAGNNLRNANSDDGIYVSGSATDFQIVNNKIVNVETEGIEISDALDNVTVRNNVIRNTGDEGLDLASGDTVENTVIENNTIDTVGDGDTWFDLDSSGTNGTVVEVSDNTFDGSGGDTVVQIDGGSGGEFSGSGNINNTPITNSSNLCNELGTIVTGSPGFDITNVDGSTVTCGDN